jgi:hypothetical protein
MKTIGVLLLSTITTTFLFSQEADSKKVQAGLVFSSGLNFQELKTDYFRSGGAGTDLTAGMNMNFLFTESIGLCTGLEFDFSNTKFESNSSIFYRYIDKEILRKSDLTTLNSSSVFQLESRKDKSIYLSIPTMMLFRTKFIGYFRYFGKFGLRNSFLLKTESFDKGVDLSTVPPNQNGMNNNMTTKGNMFFYKGAIGMCAGAEWNFSGSTSLVGELGYYYGITPLYWERSSTSDKLSLYTNDLNNGTVYDIYNPMKARQSQVMMKVSILF